VCCLEYVVGEALVADHLTLIRISGGSKVAVPACAGQASRLVDIQPGAGLQQAESNWPTGLVILIPSTRLI